VAGGDFGLDLGEDLGELGALEVDDLLLGDVGGEEEAGRADVGLEGGPGGEGLGGAGVEGAGLVVGGGLLGGGRGEEDGLGGEGAGGVFGRAVEFELGEVVEQLLLLEGLLHARADGVEAGVVGGGVEAHGHQVLRLERDEQPLLGAGTQLRRRDLLQGRLLPREALLQPLHQRQLHRVSLHLLLLALAAGFVHRHAAAPRLPARLVPQHPRELHGRRQRLHRGGGRLLLAPYPLAPLLHLLRERLLHLALLDPQLLYVALLDQLCQLYHLVLPSVEVQRHRGLVVVQLLLRSRLRLSPLRLLLGVQYQVGYRVLQGLRVLQRTSLRRLLNRGLDLHIQ